MYIPSGLPAAPGSKVIAEHDNGAAPTWPLHGHLYSAALPLDNIVGGKSDYFHPSGNLTNGSTYGYNAESELTTAASETYVYDGDGNRLEKLQNGSVVKIYWYGSGSTVLDETDGSGSMTNGNFSECIFFGASRIARRDASGNVFYYVGDHLGTSRVIAEVPSGQSSATMCYDADFYPYGGQMAYTDSCDSAYKFTGKERDSESTLDNFGARYFSSSMGRFLSPDDPFAGWDQGDPQTLNLYAYARNNALNMVDDDGHDPTLFGGTCGGWFSLCHFFQWITGLLGGGHSQEDVSAHIVSPDPDITPPVTNAMLNQRIPGQNNLTVGQLNQQGNQAMLQGIKIAGWESLKFGGLAFMFPEEDIEEVVLSSEELYSPRSRSGRAHWRKSLGTPWPKAPPPHSKETQSSKSELPA